ncbi:3-hydroxyisobutyryl-CoA hydrolase [Mortierella alpina]|uniref:3-hydroxyisobutyryl-CoA hydrolase n=1 Tax=Mortierella alpina TaxID=64518 RepID=A0A9P6J9T9_MORAP|nr:3-hydroxyisobutyryl-CoA hydrolase [Mortierella alpina]
MGYPEEKKSSSISSRKGSGEDNHYSNGTYQDAHPSRDMYDDSKSMPSRTPSVGYSGGAPMANLRTSTSSSHHPPPLPSRQPSTVHRSGSSALPRSSQSVRSIKDDYKEVYNDLCHVYKKKIKPLETTYNFEGFHSGPLSDSDIHAKPFVLLLGQYSTAHIGVEPTTDRFVAVMNGPEPRVVPGNAAAVSNELPFRGLDRFGQAFLTRFQVSQCPSPLLENMTLIDTPGILAGDKQRIERGYDFTKTIEWFAQRSDLILLFFDSHKLDISDEFKSSINALKGQEEKVRVILNKSDMVDQQQLMRVYGALMWSLGKVIQTPEVMRVYLGSFWLQRPQNAFEDCRALLDKEQADLLKDLRDLPRNAAIRKVNEIVKRARLARVHAYIIGHLRKEMPAGEFLKVQQIHSVPAGDFPNVAAFRQSLEAYRFENFAKMSQPILTVAEEALSVDLPKIMRRFPQNNPLLELTQKNPFLGPPEPFNALNTNTKHDLPPSYWHFSSVDRASARPIFMSLNPIEGKVNGSTARPYLMGTGLTVEILAKVWTLADWTCDGYLSEDEFAVALHLIRAVENGGEGILPPTLPTSMLP